MLYSACQMAQTLTKGRFNKFSLIYSINRCSFLFTANSALSGLFCRMFRSYSHLGRKRHSFRKIDLPSSSMRSARLVREPTLFRVAPQHSTKQSRINSDFSAKIIYIPYLKETKKSELITFFQKIDLFLLSKTST